MKKNRNEAIFREKIGMKDSLIVYRKWLFRYNVLLYRAFIREQSSLDEMKGI